jgi:predicted nucleic acid-binding protein
VKILVDTGPLVAIVSPEDQYHALCVKTLATLPAPLWTCWPVVTEAAWLLRDFPRGFENLLRSFDEGFLEILAVTGAEARLVAEIMKRYASLHAQFADAMLVYLAHREKIETIFSLDRRDFTVYRSLRKSPFRLVPELT